MFFVCEDHLERALEDFAEQKVEPPEFYLLTQVQERKLEVPDNCQYCEKKPLYVVKRYAD